MDVHFCHSHLSMKAKAVPLSNDDCFGWWWWPHDLFAFSFLFWSHVLASLSAAKGNHVAWTRRPDGAALQATCVLDSKKPLITYDLLLNE